MADIFRDGEILDDNVFDVLVGAFKECYLFPSAGTLANCIFRNAIIVSPDFTFTTSSTQFKFNGYVQVEGVSASRTVYLYRRSDGLFVGSAVSNEFNSGYFEINSPYEGDHFCVILPAEGETYNLLVRDKINPEN